MEQSMGTYDNPPRTGGWLLIEKGPFEDLTGPLFWSLEDLGADEPFRIGFRVAPRHCNPNNSCHGGMIATFMDLALGLAVRAAAKVDGPTMSLTIDYLGPALVGDWVESRARFIHATWRTGYCDAVAIGPRGPVARGNGIFRLNRPKQG